MTDAEVLDAVAAEAGWMEDLLVRLVEAPTVLGAEEAGQALMEAAFRDCGLAPRSVPLDADGAARRGGRVAVLLGRRRASAASWPTGAAGAGRSLILNGHVDVVPPAAEALWTLAAVHRRAATATGSTAAARAT